MAWVVRRNNSLLFAGVTAKDAVENFIKVTREEPKHLVASAINKYINGADSLRVNKYTLKWEQFDKTFLVE